MEKFFVDPDITQAETLPPRFYKSQEIFEKLKETVFLKTWNGLEILRAPFHLLRRFTLS